MKGEENRFTQILNLLYIYFHVEINVTIIKIIKKKIRERVSFNLFTDL
jgi:hypothetical protein